MHTVNRLFEIWRIADGDVIKVRTLAKTYHGAIKDVTQSTDIQYCYEKAPNTKVFVVDGEQEWKCALIT